MPFFSLYSEGGLHPSEKPRYWLLLLASSSSPYKAAAPFFVHLYIIPCLIFLSLYPSLFLFSIIWHFATYGMASSLSSSHVDDDASHAILDANIPFVCRCYIKMAETAAGRTPKRWRDIEKRTSLVHLSAMYCVYKCNVATCACSEYTSNRYGLFQSISALVL